MTETPYPDPQQNPQRGSKFGTEGYAPGAFGGPMAEPKQFQTLKTLTLVALGIYLLSQVTSLVATQSQGFADATRDMFVDLGMPSGEIDALVSQQTAGAMSGAVVGGIIGLGLFLLVYLGLTKRKNWARVTGIVFAILGVIATGLSTLLIGALLAAAGAAGVLSLILVLAYVAVSIYWLVLAFNGQVKQYLQQT